MSEQVAISRGLAESLLDPDACRFDHHGGCQAHGYLDLQPGELCPQAELRAALAAVPVPDTAPLAADDFADALERAMRDHILDKRTGWPHRREYDTNAPVDGCDDLCATDIAARLAPDTAPEAER